MQRLALILALVAALFSGGGVARFTHVMLAHGGEACSGHASGGWELPGGLGRGCGHLHAGATHRHLASERPGSPERSTEPVDERSCAVCAELAFCMPAPDLSPAFHDAIAVLATVHDAESGRVVSCGAPEVCGARPPPRA